MSMKRVFFLISILAVISCGKVDDAQLQAVGSGKAIKKVVVGDVEYDYQYDSEGRLTKISRSDSAPELRFEYSEEGGLTVKGGNYTRTYSFGNVDELVRVSYRFKDIDAGVMTFVHSDGFPVYMNVTSQDGSDLPTTEYEWKDGNMVKMSSLAELDVPGLYTEYVYSMIINNFKVPLPCYCALNVYKDSYFYPLMRSKNLPKSIRVGDTDDSRTFSYDFDSEGNICKVTVESFNGASKVSAQIYEILYQ